MRLQRNRFASEYRNVVVAPCHGQNLIAIAGSNHFGSHEKGRNIRLVLEGDRHRDTPVGVLPLPANDSFDLGILFSGRKSAQLVCEVSKEVSFSGATTSSLTVDCQ